MNEPASPAASASAVDQRGWWSRRLCALVTLFALFHLASGRRILPDDGMNMLVTAQSLVRCERPAVTYHFGLGQSLALAPVAAAIDPGRWEDDRWARATDNWTIKLVPAFAAALAVLLFYEVARRAGAPRSRAIAAAAIVAVGTPLLPYSRVLFAETTLAPCLLAALLPLAVRDARRVRAGGLALCGVALGFGLLTKATFAVAALPVGSIVLWRERALAGEPLVRRIGRLVALGAPVVLSLAAALWWNQFRYGAATQFGYRDGNDALGFSWRFAKLGVPGLLGSSGKGALFYAPVLLVAIALWPRFSRGRGALAAAGGASFVGSVLLHGSWWAWHGDWAWGPRFLVPYLPPLCLSLVAFPLGAGIFGRMKTALAVAIVAASVGVQALGVLVNPWIHLRFMLLVVHFGGTTSRQHTDAVVVDELWHAHFMPAFSPIRSHLWLLESALAHDPDPAPRCPWYGVGPPEWTRGEVFSQIQDMDMDLWVLDRNLPHREDRIAIEVLVAIAGATLMVRALRAAGGSSGHPRDSS